MRTEPQIEVRVDNRAAWLATSPTTVVPSRFTASVVYAGLRIGLDVRASPATGPRIFEVRVQAPLTGEGLSAEALRLPLGRLRRQVVEAATRPVVERVPGGGYVVEDGEPPWFGAVQRGPGRGKPLDDDHLRRVVEVYRAAVAAGSRSPVEDVRRTFHASRPTAGRWIVQARRRGLLGPARGTVAGEAEPDSSRT